MIFRFIQSTMIKHVVLISFDILLVRVQEIKTEGRLISFLYFMGLEM